MATQEKLSWRGQDLMDRDGGKLGRIEEIYLDADTDQPEWALVHTGLFGTKQTFVPIRDASATGDGVTVPFDQATVKGAPKAEADGQLSQDEEAALYSHYGMSYSEANSDSGLPEGGAPAQQPQGVVGNDVSGPETDTAMTRSEEEVRIGTTQRETGRARLKKYIETEMVTETVPVTHEEVRIEREPITDANVGNATDGPELSEEEHEVTLRAEEPVVEKRVVPKERVRMEKDVITDEVEVSEEVRKERIDADGPGAV
jgi:uncharacterized protein (TIGR02271 family)